MKTQRVQIYTNNQQYRNHCSSAKSNKYNNEPQYANITFMANVAKLNRQVFVQRNIIKQEDSLSRFVDRIFRKIYQHDHGKNYALYIHPKLKHFDDVSL